MEDQRIKHQEEMVGAGHPTKPDTLNRFMLVEHENTGKHKGGFFLMQVTETHIQWKHLYDEDWQDLVAIAELIGPQGIAGNEVSLQTSATHVQWKLGDGEWENLIALADLTGAQGDPGTPAENISLQTSATHVQWKLGDGEWTNLIALADLVGAQGDPGTPGTPGDDGEEVSLQKTATHIQWKLGDGEWTNLVALADLKGDPGDLELGETSATAYRGDRGKTADDHSQVTHAPSDANNYSHPNHSGDVTSSGDGAQTIASKAVTLAKMDDLAQNRIIGRVSASTGVPEALTPANVRTIAEINDLDTERAKRLWRLVPAANYTARPPSTSTITMGTDMTATIKVGMSLRYTWNGTEYIGQVSAIASNLLTIRGAPLSTSYDVSNLQFGGGEVIELVLPVNGLYEDAANTALLTSDNKSPLIWLKEAAYIVHYRMWSRLHDTHATHGKASIRANNAEVNSSADGLEIAADATWYSTVVDINASNYDIQPGEALEVTATKGGNGNAEDLCAIVVAIIP